MKNSSKIIKEFIPLLLILLVLVLVIISNDGFGWFTSNKVVDAGNPNITPHIYDVNIEYEYYKNQEQIITEDASSFVTFTDLKPGDIIMIKASLTNNEDSTLETDCQLMKPNNTVETGYEIPIIDSVENKYYYLGTQLKIKAIRINSTDNPTAVGIGKYLVEPEGFHVDGFPTKCDVSEELTVDKLDVVTTVSLLSNQTTIVEIEIEFVNTSFSQNAFLGFGKGDEKSSRYTNFIFYKSAVQA